MTSVTLDFDEFISFQPAMLDFGGSLVGALGGEEQRLNRQGNRFTATYAVDFDTDEEARAFVQDLRLAMRNGATAPFPQSGLRIGIPGTPLVDGAVSGGTSLPLKSMTPHYAIRKGQFCSILLSGRRYLYSAASAVIADASGNATVTIDPPLRKALAGDEPVSFAQVTIEGSLQGDEVQWETATSGYEPFVFTIREMA